MTVPLKRQNIVLVLALLGLSVAMAGCTKISTSSEVSGPKPQPGQVAVLDSDVIINSPLSGALISSPVNVTGRVKIGSEDTVYIRVRDAQNYVLGTSTVKVTANQSGWATYDVTLEFLEPATPSGAVDVFFGDLQALKSANLLSLPVKFSNYKNPVVALYYSNIIEDPNLLDCSSVHPVEREIQYSANIIGSTLNALFQGPTDEEIKLGFVNNLPETEVTLNNMELSSTTGVLLLDFNQALQEGVAGSCRVTAIRAQIEETVKQFNGIEGVVISIDGETQGVLQP